MSTDVNENGLTFGAWLLRANTAVHEETDYAVGLNDLPDGNSNDAWRDGVSPRDYAVMLLEEEGFYDYVNAEPAPAPARERQGYNLAPYGESYEEVITLENGNRYRIRRQHAANGVISVIEPLGR